MCSEKTKDSLRIWHPYVHRRFGESLYYYICAVRPLGAEYFKNTLESFLKKEGLSGYCYYAIYGSFDILVRIWLPSDFDEEFENKLRSLEGVRQVHPFRVATVPIYWCREDNMADFDRTALDKLSIDTVKSVQNNSASSNTIGELRKSCLLTDIDIAGNIKFFVSMNPTLRAERSAEDQLVKYIIERISAAVSDRYLHRPSLYVGYGFAWSILKGEVAKNDFFSIKSLVYDINDKLSPFGVSLTTYICCEERPKETDGISERSFVYARGKDLMVADLVPEIYGSDTISIDLRREIHQWVQNNVELGNLVPNERKILHDCLVGIINEDENAFYDSLLDYFRVVERHIRSRYMHFVSKRTGGKNKDIINLLNIPKDKLMSLGEFLDICSKAVELTSNSIEDKELVGNWQPLANIRNKSAHGSLEPIKEWKDCLSLMIKYFPRIRKLISVIDEGTE